MAQLLLLDAFDVAVWLVGYGRTSDDLSRYNDKYDAFRPTCVRAGS
jgi:hypothetical protein